MNDSESTPLDASRTDSDYSRPTAEYIENAPVKNGFRYDPVEDTEEYKRPW